MELSALMHLYDSSIGSNREEGECQLSLFLFKTTEWRGMLSTDAFD